MPEGFRPNLKLPPKKIIKLRPVDDGPKEWYYIDAQNENRGPFSARGLKGFIQRETLVWKDGMADWQTAGSIAELGVALLGIRPELPPKAISDKWMWTLATIPIPLGWILGLITGGNVVLVIVALFALNCTFIGLDMKELSKAGRDIGTALYLGLLFVPVYMFVRAAKYTQRYAPAIVWSVLFGVDLMFSVIVSFLQAIVSANGY